jgi:hypothetical protein
MFSLAAVIRAKRRNGTSGLFLFWGWPGATMIPLEMENIRPHCCGASNDGAECQLFIAGFKLEGEIYLLTFPFIESLTEIPKNKKR